MINTGEDDWSEEADVQFFKRVIDNNKGENDK